jgi:myo-inositol-1-phosphate synthase
MEKVFKKSELAVDNAEHAPEHAQTYTPEQIADMDAADAAKGTDDVLADQKGTTLQDRLKRQLPSVMLNAVIEQRNTAQNNVMQASAKLTIAAEHLDEMMVRMTSMEEEIKELRNPDPDGEENPESAKG